MEKSNEKVSIVTPNFNSEKFILETASSIFNQKYKHWEWIIVDDNSSDNSFEIIESFCKNNPKVILMRNDTGKKGGSVCRNLGLKNASGKWLLFFDADDILEDFCLEKRVQRMNENFSLDFAVFNIQCFYEYKGDSSEIFNKYFNSNEEYLNNFLNDNIPWQTSCPLWKREFLVRNNIQFSEKYSRLQDVEFHSRILLNYDAKFEVFKTDLPDSFYRVLRNTTNKFTLSFVEKLMNSFLVFFGDFAIEIKISTREDKIELENCLFQKYKKSIDLLLLQAPIYNFNKLKNFNNACSKLFLNKNCISDFNLLLFYIFNVLKLNKVKGLGVYRLYKFLVK